VRSLRGWLGLDRQDAAAEEESLRGILDALDRLEPARARFLAAFAYLLGRVARADLHVSDEETRTMERLVMEKGHLTAEHAMLVVGMAKSSNRLFGGTANLIVSREFAGMASYPERLALLEALYAVSMTDAGVTTIEDNEIRQVSRELRVEHRDFIAIRSAYRGHLTVLQREERDERDV
jgi:uncharacterized tellurite resistance protein B-like protein